MRAQTRSLPNFSLFARLHIWVPKVIITHYHTQSLRPEDSTFLLPFWKKIHCERKLLLKPETLNIEISGPRCALLIYVVTT